LLFSDNGDMAERPGDGYAKASMCFGAEAQAGLCAKLEYRESMKSREFV
jgi:hypothetical protein